jgi:rSAM/selenodomain-associated transferase 2
VISVVIPTLDAEKGLAETLGALVPATVDGLVREVIIIDGGSTDRTAAIADDAGATFVVRTGGRGHQLAAGARRAKFPWLLFLHADTVLEPGWEREAASFMSGVDNGKRALGAAAFRFALDDVAARARVLERFVALRCALFRLPYGDQGLLIPKPLYDRIGGYNPHPVMEDVEIARRLGRRRLSMLRARAVTDARRFKEEGYARRTARNLSCLGLYFLGVSTGTIDRIYRRRPRINSP